MVKQKVTVQPGGVVHVQSSELVPGSTADVIIIPDTGASPSSKLAGLIGSAAGGFASPAEVDAFIRVARIVEEKLDRVLDKNAEEFVNNYFQMPGQ